MQAAPPSFRTQAATTFWHEIAGVHLDQCAGVLRCLKLATSSILYGNASPVWCVTRLHSLKSSPITSAPSSFSYAVTTSPGPQPYLDNTTFQSLRSSDDCAFLTFFRGFTAVWN